MTDDDPEICPFPRTLNAPCLEKAEKKKREKKKLLVKRKGGGRKPPQALLVRSWQLPSLSPASGREKEKKKKRDFPCRKKEGHTNGRLLQSPGHFRRTSKKEEGGGKKGKALWGEKHLVLSPSSTLRLFYRDRPSEGGGEEERKKKKMSAKVLSVSPGRRKKREKRRSKKKSERQLALE